MTNADAFNAIVSRIEAAGLDGHVERERLRATWTNERTYAALSVGGGDILVYALGHNGMPSPVRSGGEPDERAVAAAAGAVIAYLRGDPPQP